MAETRGPGLRSISRSHHQLRRSWWKSGWRPL